MKKAKKPFEFLEGQCAEDAVCPLNQVKAGTVVCIKQLLTSPDVRDRLREMGLCEDHKVKLLSSHSSIICQICNARVGLSQKLAEAILVEPVTKPS